MLCLLHTLSVLFSDVQHVLQRQYCRTLLLKQHLAKTKQSFVQGDGRHLLAASMWDVTSWSPILQLSVFVFLGIVVSPLGLLSQLSAVLGLAVLV